MLNTYYYSYTVLSKVYANGSYIKQALNNTQVEERNRPAITKICYGVLDKDVTLDYIVDSFCAKKPKTPVKILLKIGIYAIKYLNTVPHAVTDTLVSLCKKLGKGGVSGFVNAVLRNFIRKGIELPKGSDIKSLSIYYSYPEFLTEKLINSYGLETAKQIMAFDDEYTYLRFESNGESYLNNLGVNYQKTVFENLYKVDNFRLDGGFYEGIYTFQSIGSVAICSQASGGEKLLDCCSAPGGKAVLLSSKYQSVIACDIHEHRVSLIKSYAERMNKTNITAQLQDATRFCPEFEGQFDTVLCDVPCSGTGVIKQNPDIKLNRSSSGINEICDLQKKILKNASKYVKKGGELIYSTCSILPEENDGVIEDFIKSSDNFKVENSTCKLSGIKSKFGLQFLPNLSQGAGFYVCTLKKL